MDCARRTIIGVVLSFIALITGISGQPHGHQQPCSESWTRCNWTGVCIPPEMLCNGYNNCGDWEDESHCPSTTTTSAPVTLPSCYPGEVLCNGTGTCIIPQVLCDGYNNCGDGEDETHCSSTPAPSGCGDVSVQKGSHNTISSMNYPYHHYDNNAHCFWTIEVDPGQNILLQFEPIFDLQNGTAGHCEHDSLMIYQSYIYHVLGTYCGSTVPFPILVRSDHAMIRFASDQSGTGRGFGIRWTAVPPIATVPITPIPTTTMPTPGTQTSVPTASPSTPGPWRDCPVGGSVLRGSRGELRSPGYSLSESAHYPPSVSCSWLLVAPAHSHLVLHFHDFMLESSPNCSSDSLTVYDGSDETGDRLGRLCGKYLPQDLTSNRSQLFLQFFSDGGVEGRGFKVTWTSFSTVTTPHLPQTTPPPGTGCDGTAVPLTSASGEVTSPGFDSLSAYAKNLNCQWHITVAPGHVIELRFKAFDMEWTNGCTYDFLVIYDGSDYNKEQVRLCGDRPPPEFTSTSNSVLIKMHSDEEVAGSGFNLTYTSHPSTGKCTASQFTCPTGLCITYDKVCDGHPNCPAGEDEIICPNVGDCGRPLITPQLEETRVVGGREAVWGSWPWQASLRMSGKHMCGGTLIHPLWVLTATHCFDSNWHTEDWTVMLGSQELLSTPSSHQQLLNVSDIFLRHDYDHVTSDNDVALLKLARPAVRTTHVQPVCLASIVLPPGQICYVTGFGETLSTCCAGKLKQAAVPLIDRETCNRPDWYRGQVLPNMVCAGFHQGGTDACGGDSGGPLVCQTGRHWVVYGVTSWGISCADAKHPGVYMRVADFVKWIQETVAKHS